VAAIIFADLALSEGHPDEICAATLVIRAMLLGGADLASAAVVRGAQLQIGIGGQLGSERVADLKSEPVAGFRSKQVADLRRNPRVGMTPGGDLGPRCGMSHG
jgi:hypothetical protein